MARSLRAQPYTTSSSAASFPLKLFRIQSFLSLSVSISVGPNAPAVFGANAPIGLVSIGMFSCRCRGVFSLIAARIALPVTSAIFACT
jgi:hypothetical protein